MTSKVHGFQTGRLYSALGQRIGWTRLATGNVVMNDIDRGIPYVLAFPKELADEQITDRDVLRAYDANRVAPFDYEEWKQAQALQPTLRIAAELAPPVNSVRAARGWRC